MDKAWARELVQRGKEGRDADHQRLPAQPANNNKYNDDAHITNNSNNDNDNTNNNDNIEGRDADHQRLPSRPAPSD